MIILIDVTKSAIARAQVLPCIEKPVLNVFQACVRAWAVPNCWNSAYPESAPPMMLPNPGIGMRAAAALIARPMPV
ncbi:MAG: hypothetical protein NT062_12530 [Proteobacteria bacterium]|nr:hypothetical protein [Pseudomonadota bacterium]